MDKKMSKNIKFGYQIWVILFLFLFCSLYMLINRFQQGSNFQYSVKGSEEDQRQEVLGGRFEFYLPDKHK